MAISKRRSRRATGAPDPAVFDQIVRDGLAEVEVVVDAYEHALGEWLDELRRTGAKAANDPEAIAQERPVVDPNEPLSVAALSITRHRARHFIEQHPTNALSNEPQEDQ